jgi:hypothetical protein
MRINEEVRQLAEQKKQELIKILAPMKKEEPKQEEKKLETIPEETPKKEKRNSFTIPRSDINLYTTITQAPTPSFPTIITDTKKKREAKKPPPS